MDSVEIITQIKQSWNESAKLQELLLNVAERQLQLASMIASEDVNYNAAFVDQREESIRGTDALARARAKSLTGNAKMVYEYEFEVLNNILTIIISRISQLRVDMAQYLESL